MYKKYERPRASARKVAFRLGGIIKKNLRTRLQRHLPGRIVNLNHPGTNEIIKICPAA